MIRIKFYGFYLGASCHDLTQDQLKKLKKQKYYNPYEVIPDYDIWATNYFDINAPIIDDSLQITVINGEGKLLWSSDSDAFGLSDIDEYVWEYAKIYPEVEDIIDDWENGKLGPPGAVVWDEHPRILYYEEIAFGFSICDLNIEKFDPKKLLILVGNFESGEYDWSYVQKVFYAGKPYQVLVKDDHKVKSEKFKLLF